MASIEARGLSKAYRKTVALDRVDLTVGEGRIVGLIGPNGAGKSTALNAILGLIPYDGELSVLGRNPWTDRDALMLDVAFISDVAVLPRWIRVAQALDYVEGVHPRFDRAKADAFLARTNIKRRSRVRELSKGMVTQLHLALVMAIDARLLVLDEPTLGLDILFRKQFYDTLINDYWRQSAVVGSEPRAPWRESAVMGSEPRAPWRQSAVMESEPRAPWRQSPALDDGSRAPFVGQRTILITTHQVDEIEEVLTDVLFIDRGRIVLSTSMDAFDARYREVVVRPDSVDAARALHPIRERQVFGRPVMLFDGVDDARLVDLGEVRTPSIADLFVALVGQPEPASSGARQ